MSLPSDLCFWFAGLFADFTRSLRGQYRRVQTDGGATTGKQRGVYAGSDCPFIGGRHAVASCRSACCPVYFWRSGADGGQLAAEFEYFAKL